MKCKKASQLLPVYLDEELGEDEKRNLEKHLVSCERCQACLRKLKEVVHLTKELDEESIPSFLAQRVRDEAKQSVGVVPLRRKFDFKSAYRYALIASGVLALVLAISFSTMQARWGIFGGKDADDVAYVKTLEERNSSKRSEPEEIVEKGSRDSENLNAEKEIGTAGVFARREYTREQINDLLGELKTEEVGGLSPDEYFLKGDFRSSDTELAKGVVSSSDELKDYLKTLPLGEGQYLILFDEKIEFEGKNAHIVAVNQQTLDQQKEWKISIYILDEKTKDILYSVKE